MPAHPLFAEMQAEERKKYIEIEKEEFKEHDYKTSAYNGLHPPLHNWTLVEPMMRPWQGCYARITEKIARLFVLAEEGPLNNPEKWHEVLKEISVYCKMERILFSMDFDIRLREQLVKDDIKK